MALIVSLASGGADVGSTKIDYGDITVGNSGQQTLYMRNTYNNNITNVTLYFAEAATYTGNASAALDFAELQDWASATPDDSTGNVGNGLMLSQDGGSNYSQLKLGTLDSQANGEAISGGATPGEIAGGGTEELSSLYKVAVPAGEADGGERDFDLNIYYRYTS